MANVNPTPTQLAYLDFIGKYVELHKRPPAEHEMQAFFMVSPPAVHQMVVTLTKKGFITRQPGKARSIRLVGQHTRPERLSEAEYLKNIERLAKTVVHEAVREGSFEVFLDEGSKTDLQRTISDLARTVRYVHYPGDGCLEHVRARRRSSRR